MNKPQILIDHYLHGYSKFIAIYLLITALLGSINYLASPTGIFDLLIGLMFLILSGLILIFYLGNKGLSISEGNLNIGVSFGRVFFILGRINLEKYSEFACERKEKSSFPWLLEYSGFGLFSNHNECLVYLINPESKNNIKKIISLSDYKMYDEIRFFLENWTELKEISFQKHNNCD